MRTVARFESAEALRFEARVDVLNVTDAFNWRATSTPFAGADLVTREIPRRVQAQLKV